MKITFFLDNNQFIDAAPETLQLVQLEPGNAALGMTLEVPKLDDDKQPIFDEDKKPVTQPAFVPIINFPVDIIGKKNEAGDVEAKIAADVDASIEAIETNKKASKKKTKGAVN